MEVSCPQDTKAAMETTPINDSMGRRFHTSRTSFLCLKNIF